MKANNLVPVLAILALGVSVCAHASITSYSAELSADGWRPGLLGEPLRGNASLALDDSTNELSWAIEWFGTDERQAELTMRGVDDEEGTPLVFALGSGVSNEDKRGGGLSGIVRLTPQQVHDLSSEDWQLELRFSNPQGLRLTGKLQLDALPPGLWL